jgi:hypothetical protein
MADRFPTADQVATAIVAACRETGEDPIEVMDGVHGLRARHYAAHALAKFWPPVVGEKESRALLGRLVGVKAPESRQWTWFTTSLNQVFKPYENTHRGIKFAHWARWFDDEAFARIVAALEAAMQPAAPIPPPAPKRPQAVAAAPARPVVVSTVARSAAEAFRCESCGGPRSVGSAKICRKCYTETGAPIKPTSRTVPDDTVAARARQAERAIEAPDRFAGLGPHDYVPGSSGKRALQEMLANAAAETARQQARQRGE